MGDDFVGRRVLVLEQLLQGDDARQDERQLSDDQGLERDQSEGSDGEGQEGGGLQLQQQQKWQQELLAFLAFATCERNKRSLNGCYWRFPSTRDHQQFESLTGAYE